MRMRTIWRERKEDFWKEKMKVNGGFRRKNKRDKVKIANFSYNVCGALWFGNSTSIISFYS